MLELLMWQRRGADDARCQALQTTLSTKIAQKPYTIRVFGPKSLKMSPLSRRVNPNLKAL